MIKILFYKKGRNGLVIDLLCVWSAGEARPIKVGDPVCVKPSVQSPKYKWGLVTAASMGIVKCGCTFCSQLIHVRVDGELVCHLLLWIQINTEQREH